MIAEWVELGDHVKAVLVCVDGWQSELRCVVGM